MNTNISLQPYIQPILFILNKAKQPLDAHKISKILYFADREHLAKYGTSISNDNYIKMQYGPVPSTIYDIVKAVLGKRGLVVKSDVEDYFNISSHDKIEAKINFDEDEFSRSEIECLEISLSEHLEKSFGFLSEKSHDDAWCSAVDSIDNINIAKAGGADENMLTYISHYNEILTSKFK